MTQVTCIDCEKTPRQTPQVGGGPDSVATTDGMSKQRIQQKQSQAMKSQKQKMPGHYSKRMRQAEHKTECQPYSYASAGRLLKTRCF